MNSKRLSVFRGLNILVTLGPTREHWDSVRFISNASSGKMGLSLARAFRAAGAKVSLVAGPGVLGCEDFKTRRVVSARDMLRETSRLIGKTDVFVSAAAVADYRPANALRAKAPKSGRPLTLRLVPNPDILAAMGRKKARRFHVGFALEDGGSALERERRARQKLVRKNCDLIVLNTPSSVESARIDATLIFRVGPVIRLGKITKESCANHLCRVLSQNLPNRNI